MKMKSEVLFILLLSTLSFSIVSCENPDEPQKPTTISEVIKDYQDYLLNCYTEGQEVIFEQEKGTSTSYIVEAIYSDADTEDGYIECGAILTNKQNVLNVELVAERIKDGTINEYGNVVVLTMSSEEESNIDCDVIHTISHLYLKSEQTNYCVLEKAKGITSFSDGKGHTWTKK